MKKTKILMSLLLIMLLTASVFTGCGGGGSSDSSDNSAGPTYQWRLGTQEAEGVPLTISAHAFADAVRDLSAGDIEITVYPSNQLGGYEQTFDEIKMGTIELGWLSGSSMFDPMIDIQGIPYLVENWDQARKLWSDRDGYIYKKWDETMQNQGVKLLGISPAGFLGCGGRNFGDLNTVFDSTVKHDALIRVPPMELAVQIVQALGYRTTTIPYADLYPALQTGVADGWYGGSATLNYESFRDVIDIFIDYKYLFEIMGMFMNEDLFDSLPADVQDLLVQAAIDEQARAFDYYEAYAEDGYKALEDYGINVMYPTDEEMKAIAADVRAKVYPGLDDMFGADVMKGILDQVNSL